MPRRQIGRRQPLWQQRQRAAQLLEVAASYPTFPIIAETVREVLQDVFDVPGPDPADARHRRPRRCVSSRSRPPTPSPFAQSLLFGYVAQFLYEGDSPLAERRAAALAVDPALLADLLGHGDGLALRDLLDPAAIERTEHDLQRLADERKARTAEEIVDLLRVLGPLSADEIADRCTEPAAVPGWLDGLVATRRIVEVRVAGAQRFCDVGDVAALRDGLGVPVPLGVAIAFLEPVSDPLLRLFGRYSRVRGPFTAADVAVRFGIGSAVADGRAAPVDRDRPAAAGGVPARGVGRHRGCRRVRRRRGAPAAPAAVTGQPARRGRTGAGVGVRPIPARLERHRTRRPPGGPAPRVATDCSGWSSSWPARWCRRPRWRR